MPTPVATQSTAGARGIERASTPRQAAGNSRAPDGQLAVILAVGCKLGFTKPTAGQEPFAIANRRRRRPRSGSVR